MLTDFEMIRYRCPATMLRCFVISIALNAIFVASVVDPGPKYPPTKGEVWPKPQQERKENAFFTFDPAQFKVEITNQNCTILVNAIQRYSYAWNQLRGIASNIRNRKLKRRRRLLEEPDNARPEDANYMGNIRELQVELTAPCEEYPSYQMDESYNLTVVSTSKLTSASIWGILRGLETFAQLFYLTDDFKDLRINATRIVDYPRYAHRGLLLDTSRHFITLANIMTTLDAMTMNKLNVFHWHIVDDQSFPYQSEKFPHLSATGAYHPSMVYTRSDINRVVNYARDRGIRVIPEFDVPGHTRSWGAAYPNILTECYDRGGKVIGLGPMNPIRNVTYKLLRDLFQEVQEWFPDKYFHVGGDEVELSCWSSNPELVDYMKLHDMTSASELHSLFMRNTIPLLANNSIPIVWQEVFDEHVPLSKDTLVQVWRETFPSAELVRVLLAGHRVLFSSAWYLDHLSDTFQDFFTVDPRQMVKDATNNDTLAENIVGGEACMWAEMVDNSNVLSRVWPRASAVAERLWSPGLGRTRTPWHRVPVPMEALRRIEEHVCRMIRRGVPAQPANGPGFCVA